MNAADPVRDAEFTQALGAFARIILTPSADRVRELDAFVDPTADLEVRSRRVTDLALSGPLILGGAIRRAYRGAEKRRAGMRIEGDMERTQPHHVLIARLAVAYMNDDAALWDDLVAAHLRVHGEGMAPDVLQASVEYVDQSLRGVPRHGEFLRLVAQLR